MARIWLLVLLSGIVSNQAYGQTQPKHSPLLRGTINVVAASDQGIVVLTDSMLTATRLGKHGTVTSHQLREPGQKLFRIDNRTVCTFAGFASAGTPSVPDFLHSTSAIMGRFEDRVKKAKALTVADKLKMLEVVFSYYLTGVANIRHFMLGKGDYNFELLIAGYDPDGTAEAGRLVLRMAPPGGGETLFHPITEERDVWRVGGTNLFLFAGMTDVAEQILRNPSAWNGDKAVSNYEDAMKHGKSLTIEQLEAFAVSVKRYTAKRHVEVGGDSQVAVLSAGHIQSFKQPEFPPLPLTTFKFQIFADMDVVGDSEEPSRIMGFYGALSPGCFPLYLNDSFTRVRQEISDAFYSGNVFKESILSYGGGKVQFDKSNVLVESDLLIGPKVRRDSPEVRRLKSDFKWRHIEFEGKKPPKVYGAEIVLDCIKDFPR